MAKPIKSKETISLANQSIMFLYLTIYRAHPININTTGPDNTIKISYQAAYQLI